MGTPRGARNAEQDQVSAPCDACVCPQFVDMDGWVLLSSDRQVVPHELRPEMELLHADLRLIADNFPELYWQAPASYLGDRVSRSIWSEGLYFLGYWGKWVPMRVHPGTLELCCKGA